MKNNKNKICKHKKAYPIADGPDDFVMYCPNCGEVND
jgi:hypothetical protein